MDDELIRLSDLSHEYDLRESDIVGRCRFLEIPIYLDFRKDLYPNGGGIYKGLSKIEGFTPLDISLAGLAEITNDGLLELEQRMRQGFANLDLIIGLEMKLRAFEKTRDFENVVVQMLDPREKPTSKSKYGRLPLLCLYKSDLKNFTPPPSNSRYGGNTKTGTKKKNSKPYTPRTPVAIFASDSIKSGQRDWKISWGGFKKLADNKTFHSLGDNSFTVRKKLIQTSKGSEDGVILEFDIDGKKPKEIAREAFRKVFSSVLKKISE